MSASSRYLSPSYTYKPFSPSSNPSSESSSIFSAIAKGLSPRLRGITPQEKGALAPLYKPGGAPLVNRARLGCSRFAKDLQWPVLISGMGRAAFW